MPDKIYKVPPYKRKVVKRKMDRNSDEDTSSYEQSDKGDVSIHSISSADILTEEELK
jgi:hypothetical protein